MVILDVLGVKGMWHRPDAKEVVHRLYHVSDITKRHIRRPRRLHFDIEQQSEKELAGIHRRIDFRVFGISDTVVILASGPIAASKLIRHLAADLYSLNEIALRHEVVFRGAISFGEFYVQGQSLVGPAVDEASEWHALPDCAGIVLTPSSGQIVDKLARSPKPPEVIGFVKLPVPLKGGSRARLWILDWYRCWHPLSLLEKAFLRAPVSPDVALKLENTLTICRQIWKEFETRNLQSLVWNNWRDVTDLKFRHEIKMARARSKAIELAIAQARGRLEKKGRGVDRPNLAFAEFLTNVLDVTPPHRVHRWNQLMREIRTMGR